MKKLLNYIITHFKIQKSHEEESNHGCEIRWTILNISFLKKKTSDDTKNCTIKDETKI